MSGALWGLLLVGGGLAIVTILARRQRTVVVPARPRLAFAAFTPRQHVTISRGFLRVIR